ncbi:hypothetical protein [Bradyrhizobium brasilense]|uniref:hypothetical protein n=1 Tax=Bradyrhizobium brasilense TaxID=1419277 RepID=UPI001E3D7B0A|nr:hypothetical protein [Bradyrhizobium brasilense]MCC8972636.1 hypothetical protein [Bradyrhizobium brasilense]
MPAATSSAVRPACPCIVFVGKSAKTLSGERIGLPGEIASAQRLLLKKVLVYGTPRRNIGGRKNQIQWHVTGLYKARV